MESMHNTNSAVVAQKEKVSATFAQQKTFNRLIKKVQELQNKQEKLVQELEEAAQFYHTILHPDELVLLQHVTERITISYEFYTTAQGYSKKELKAFKEWLADQVSQVCSMYAANEIPDAIKRIFKAVHDVDYETSFTETSNRAIESIQEEFKEVFGEDIDLSDIDMTGSPEDIMRNVFMKMGEIANERNDEASQTPKNKKQLEKEAKKLAAEQLQNKSLHNVYKQLARTLHPDLEQNVEKRALKEELMKKVTAAYDKNDLYALLKVEMEWMNHSVGTMNAHNDSEIKIYNAILKDQVKELEAAQEMIVMNPRYAVLQRFYPYGFTSVATLQFQHQKLKAFTQDVQTIVERLKTAESKTIFKELIQGWLDMEKNERCDCGSC